MDEAAEGTFEGTFEATLLGFHQDATLDVFDEKRDEGAEEVLSLLEGI